MASNIDKYKSELSALVHRGTVLLYSMEYECSSDVERKKLQKELGAEAEKVLKALKSFRDEYQSWYSEAKAVVRQVIPDRLDDLTALYEKPKGRKEISNSNYVIHDYLQGIQVSLGVRELATPRAALPQFRQQLNILKSAEARFQSSLFDIKNLVLADLLDSEIESARVLLKSKFIRAAGAVAGVVLERHLSQVTSDRGLKVTKKHPTIADLNEVLKAGGIVDIAQWRYIQHLADIRNLCDHSKDKDPTIEQVSDLLDGVAKMVKTIF